MYSIDYSITTAREVPNPLKRTKAKTKPLTSRLRKSKNFWKLDRSLDDYIDRTDLIKCGPKRLLRKLLLLRPWEDSNEVKVTANGLSELMNVTVKTIRSWLKALEKAEFIYLQGNVWDKGCNYPKKKYIFPLTFPGFDLATVFIKKGAKAKYKQRMADPVKAKAKERKLARLAHKNTCPVVPPLLDCPSFMNEGETQKSKEDTNVSSSDILVSCPASAQPTPVRRTLKTEPVTVLDYAPELKDLLVAYLRENGHQGKIQWVSNFIEQEIKANKTFRFYDMPDVSPEQKHLIHEVDRLGLARSLEYVIPLLLANRGKTKQRLTLLFRFLRE